MDIKVLFFYLGITSVVDGLISFLFPSNFCPFGETLGGI